MNTKLKASLRKQEREKCGNRILKIILERVEIKPCELNAATATATVISQGQRVSSKWNRAPKTILPTSSNEGDSDEEIGANRRCSRRQRKRPSYYADYKTVESDSDIESHQDSRVESNADSDSSIESDDSILIRKNKKYKSKKQKLHTTSISVDVDVDADADIDQSHEQDPQLTKFTRPKPIINKANRKQAKLSEPKNLLPCDFCTNRFASVYTLENHILSHHVVDKPFECEICFKSFMTKHSLVKHFQNTHKKPNDSYYQCKCKSCPYVKLFTSKRDLQIHYDTAHSNFRNNYKDGSIFCPLCKIHFYSDSDFQQHLKKQGLGVQNPEENKCSICFESMDTICLLNQHRRMNHGEDKEVQPDDLGNTSNNDYNIATTASKSKEGFPCLVCAQVFRRRSDLHLHELAEKHRRWKCPICSKLFKEKNLENHLRAVHSDAKPYKCDNDDCNLTFKTRRDMRAHRIIHSTDPKVLSELTCPDCNNNKVYRKKCELVQHRANHHGGEKTFKCEFCPKMWATKADLRQHLLCHTDERPFKCSFCDAAFKKSAEATRHMKVRCGPEKLKRRARSQFKSNLNRTTKVKPKSKSKEKSGHFNCTESSEKSGLSENETDDETNIVIASTSASKYGKTYERRRRPIQDLPPTSSAVAQVIELLDNFNGVVVKENGENDCINLPGISSVEEGDEEKIGSIDSHLINPEIADELKPVKVEFIGEETKESATIKQECV